MLARHFYGQRVGERVDDGQTDAVQAARGLVCLAIEFAAGMKGRENHFERRFILELWVWIDGNAAPIVAHGHRPRGRNLDLDTGCRALQDLVNGVVENLGRQMVKSVLPRAADVHCRSAPHRIEAFEDLDILCGIAILLARPRRAVKKIDHHYYLSQNT